jgi:FAD dependent oxidoreductase TIGR03364
MTSGTFDLAVVGGGIIGLAHAHAAASRGQRVVVVERHPRANGASIRNFGFITVSGQERGEMWRLARRSRDIWAAVAARAGVRIEQQGLYLAARSAQAIDVLEAFLDTEMGEACRLLSAPAFRAASGGLGGPDLTGGLYSPHELRVESRVAIPALAAWLETGLDVRFVYGAAVLEASPPRLRTSRGVIEAGAVVVCPGDDFSSLYPEALAGFGLSRCRLSMLKLADPGVRLPGALMSDLGLVRYRGYARLPPAHALEARLRAELPGAFEHGVHLIAAQGADGTLIVGDSHHYADLPEPFAPAAAEREILAEFERATGLAPPAVLERWTGVYAVAEERGYLVHAPEPGVRIVIVTCGAGASIGFGLAERVVAELTGSGVEAAA